MPVEKHQCPRRGCPRFVDNRIFCCAPDWFALSKPARDGISRTARAHLLSPERRAAIEICRREWDGKR
jgi:hypothetical protein